MPSVLLTKDQLLSTKRRYIELEVPELGGRVRLASFSARAAIRYAELAERQRSGEQVGEELMRLTLGSALVDGEGKALFTEETVDSLLEALPPETVMTIAAEISKLNNSKEEKAPGNPEASSTTTSG